MVTYCLQLGARRKRKFADVELFPVKLVDHLVVVNDTVWTAREDPRRE
jgi:hypothetical protein